MIKNEKKKKKPIIIAWRYYTEARVNYTRRAVERRTMGNKTRRSTQVVYLYCIIILYLYVCIFLFFIYSSRAYVIIRKPQSLL